MKLNGLIPKALGMAAVLAGLAFPTVAQDTNAPAAEAKQLPPVVGTWRTLNGTEINVQPCGDKFCGTFSYIVIPAKQAELCRSTPKADFAALLLDYQNPNKSLQTRSLIGLQAVTLDPAGKKNEYTANIYNAEEGKSYDVLIWIKGDTLTLGGGCVAGLCMVTQEWPRVPDRGAPDFSCEGGV